MPTRPPPRAEELLVDAPGARVRAWRGGEGPALLVLTDCGDPLELWSEAFSALAGRFAVTMVEQPGFGYSDAGGGFDYRWRGHLDALRGALDALDVSETLALGHCVAGTQVLALADEDAGRIRAAVLAETFPATRYRDLGTGLAVHRLGRLPGVGDLLVAVGGERGMRNGARYLLRRLGDDPDWVTDEVLDRYTAPLREGHNRYGGLRHVRRWDGGAAEPIERRVDVPAAYLLGAGGHFARHEAERRAHARACGRDVEVLSDAGHFLFAERPDPFAAAVARILERLGSASG